MLSIACTAALFWTSCFSLFFGCYFYDSLRIVSFLQVANEVIGEMDLKPEEVLLAQGTLRPDLIESASHLASGKAEVIKTHHNDTELIRKLRDEVLQRQKLCIDNPNVKKKKKCIC